MRLDDLKADVIAAKRKFEKALEERWPINSHIYVNLRRGQNNPSSGIVMSHDGDGYVRVWIDVDHKDERYHDRFVRNIYYKDVVSP